MPAPLDVDREQVRMLVMSIGCTEAAKQTGIKLATILQWSARGKWLAPAEPRQLPPSMTPTPVIGVIKPADALANALAEMGGDTKLAGMEYAKLVTEHARDRARTKPEQALDRAGDVKAALQSASIAGSWQAQGVQVGVQVNVGGLSVD